jgi:hypothetical protein
MHPEILRELTSQRGREMRARAEQATLVRSAIRARRIHRRGGQAGEIVMPAIPDYVDGSFQTVPDLDEPASRPSRVPSQRHAA